MDDENSNIRNIWVHNFDDELAKISDILEKYPYVAIVSCNYNSNLFHAILNLFQQIGHRVPWSSN